VERDNLKLDGKSNGETVSSLDGVDGVDGSNGEAVIDSLRFNDSVGIVGSRSPRDRNDVIVGVCDTINLLFLSSFRFAFELHVDAITGFAGFVVLCVGEASLEEGTPKRREARCTRFRCDITVDLRFLRRFVCGVTGVV